MDGGFRVNSTRLSMVAGILLLFLIFFPILYVKKASPLSRFPLKMEDQIFFSLIEMSGTEDSFRHSIRGYF